MTIRLGLTLLLSAATHVAADASFLTFPLDCELGQTCVIEAYPDRDATGGQRDYTCGIKSRDDLNGTDIALLGFAEFAVGVNVLAAADGRVTATRDTMPDVAITQETLAALDGRDCGNAVRVEHANGFQTVYCHLKRGSIAVSEGDPVNAGDVIAQVGISGRTNYPHLRLTVLRKDVVIDPFSPGDVTTCGGDEASLWIDTPDYHRSGLFAAGVANAVPSFEDVQSGVARLTEMTAAEPMVLYGHSFFPEEGDVMAFRMIGPNGVVFEQSIEINQTREESFRAYGKRAPDSGWPIGRYDGDVRLIRNGRLLAVRHASVTVR